MTWKANGAPGRRRTSPKYQRVDVKRGHNTALRKSIAYNALCPRPSTCEVA